MTRDYRRRHPPPRHMRTHAYSDRLDYPLLATAPTALTSMSQHEPKHGALLVPEVRCTTLEREDKRACGRIAVTARSSFFLASRGSVRRFACRPGIRESNPIDERLAFPHWASMSLRYGTAVQQADPLSINLVVRRMATGLRVPGHRSPSTANSELTIGVPFLGMLTARSRKKER